jgi:hypothetical protein
MKRTIQKWLGIVSLALIGSCFVAASASAAPLQTVAIGGVTCGEYTRGSGYPATYWDCITPLTNLSGGQATANSVNSLPANITTVLQTQNAKVFLFANAANYVSFTGATAPPVGALGADTSMTFLAAPTKIAAVFQTATIDGTVTSLRGNFNAHIRQQMGRIFSDASASSLSATGPVFSAAATYDRDYINTFTSTAVWGSTMAGLHPGKTPWEILGIVYGNSNRQLYGFQVADRFATKYGTSKLPGKHKGMDIATGLSI